MSDIRENHSTKTVAKIGRVFLGLALVAAAGNLCGCDSFMDPSRTGRFEYYSTTIPILERIDVIEEPEDFWANALPPATEDLMPRDLTYYIFPGDIVAVRILGLYEPSMWEEFRRRVDAGGYFRVPGLGEVRAAGLTPEQFEEQVAQMLVGTVFTTRPQVDVVVEQSGGLRYTVYGYVQNVGQYTLDNPNLRLLDALAIAGGVPLTTERVYVLRQVVLDERILPSTAPPSGVQPPQPLERPKERPPSVEDLIRELERPENERNPPVRPGMMSQPPPEEKEQDQPPVDIDLLEPQDVVDIQAPVDSRQTQPTVDIDELEPLRPTAPPPPVDVDVLTPGTRPADESRAGSYIYVEERGEWVWVPSQNGDVAQPAAPTAPMGEPSLVLDRVIEIDYDRLSRGDSSQNIVVRPNDRVYVEGPIQGYVYIDGESARPGVYGLPAIGRLTLSRFIAASGGLGPIAVPDRIDLIRVVGHNREAKIRLNLAAIRQGTEPDIYMKPDDHIIIGTTWWATPLAIIRNGFRATYGFGFLLDRNFGNDVFGPPPENF
ncbi:MAG: polysaccharide biosynthesis/export family protein [Phycisphaerales bacterium]|nr:polysaccharide biosynthesis/export family protein [Phycisphaerales bacterium]